MWGWESNAAAPKAEERVSNGTLMEVNTHRQIRYALGLGYTRPAEISDKALSSVWIMRWATAQ